MSRARTTAAVVFLSAAALIAAPGALSASPQEIYNDYADNGRLDATYAPSDLERALNNAVVQGYKPDKTTGLKPAVEEQANEDTGTSGSSGSGTSGSGTAGQATSGTSPAKTSGGLPFTGLDLSLITLGALGLILLGAALRRVARQRA